MSDNEIDCPEDLLDRYLAGDPANPGEASGREAAEKWLRDRKGVIDPKALTRSDRYEFIAYAFKHYYQIVTEAIRKYDPNHLYLGSRLNFTAGQFDNPWFWKAVAPFHDVVSVNYYHRWGPQDTEIANWAEWGDKPVMFTEWYAKALDAKNLSNVGGGGWIVRTQKDRGEYYQHFALGALENPQVVGFHYFKYQDDQTDAKGYDREGGCNKGLVDSNEQPYAPLLDQARSINTVAYPLIKFFDERRTAPTR